MLGALHDANAEAASCPGCGRASVLQLLNTVVGDRRQRRSRESLPRWSHWCVACVLDSYSSHCFMLMLEALHDANAEAASCPGCRRASLLQLLNIVVGDRRRRRSRERLPSWCHWCVACVLDTYCRHCFMLMLCALHDANAKAASCPGCRRASVLQLLNTVVGDRRRRRSRERLPSWCHWCVACVLDTYCRHCFMLMLCALHDANAKAASCPGCRRASLLQLLNTVVGDRRRRRSRERLPSWRHWCVACVLDTYCRHCFMLMLCALHDANAKAALCPGCGRASLLQELNAVVGDRRRRRGRESLPSWCHWCVACVLDTYCRHCFMVMLGVLLGANAEAG